LEELGFPWIPSSESSLFKGLCGIFREIFFVGVRLQNIWLVAGGLEIVDEAVDLVEQTLPLFRAVLMFRHHRILVLVEPVDHLDEGSDRLELPASD
jgi:hypothetical protein